MPDTDRDISSTPEAQGALIGTRITEHWVLHVTSLILESLLADKSKPCYRKFIITKPREAIWQDLKLM